MISKSHGTIITLYEVHGTIFIAIFEKKTNEDLDLFFNLVHFRVKFFYLMHF